jgi:voltage-gated potassium channel
MSMDGASWARSIAATVFRVCLATGLLIAFYATAPLEARPEGRTLFQLVVSLLVLGLVVTWQIVSVARSPYPRLRGVEVVATSVPLLIVIFASLYFVTGRADQGSFTEPLSRFDAVYFTVTVFATVGFGDIAARSDAARVAVTIQMISNMVLIGVIAKVLLGTVQQRRRALSSAATQQLGAETDAAQQNGGAGTTVVDR